MIILIVKGVVYSFRKAPSFPVPHQIEPIFEVQYRVKIEHTFLCEKIVYIYDG